MRELLPVRISTAKSAVGFSASSIVVSENPVFWKLHVGLLPTGLLVRIELERGNITSLHQLVTCKALLNVKFHARVSLLQEPSDLLAQLCCGILGRALPSCDGLLPESSSGHFMARKCTNPLGPGVAGQERGCYETRNAERARVQLSRSRNKVFTL